MGLQVPGYSLGGLMTVTEPVVRIILKTSFSISGRRQAKL